MGTANQLRLVTDVPPVHHAHDAPHADPTRLVFEHWVFMFNKPPARTKMDAERRQAINGALALYGLDTVMLAVEGMASVPLGDKPESMRDAMRELGWFLRSAKNVERACEYGDQLRAMVQQQGQAPAAMAVPAVPSDPAAAAAARDRLKQIAAQCRGLRD